METKKFLSTVLSDQGFYCVLGIRTKDNVTVQKFYDTIDSVVDSALNFDKEGYDTYFALSTFDQHSRKAEHSSFLRSFFLDLDCGETKPYLTQTDAAEALRAFCESYDLPKPTAVVNSGRGLHVYWALDKDCSADEWVPVAEKLKSACAKNGLHADPVVTADAARILRVPYTHNFKASPPADVHLCGPLNGITSLEVFADRLGGVPVINVNKNKKLLEEDKERIEAFENTYNKSFKKILEKTGQGRGCNQIKNAIENSSTLSYPEWVSTLSIAKRCKEGKQAVHAISENYPDYSYEETEKVVESLDYPHLCETFEANNPEFCKGCRYKGKIKSPIVLGMEIREATEEDNVVYTDTSSLVDDTNAESPSPALNNVEKYVIPQYPDPYFRGARGGIYLRKKDKDGDPIEDQVYRQDLYMIKRLRDPVKGPTYVFRHHTIREGVREFSIVGTSLSSKEEFRKEMGMNDIFLLPTEVDKLMRYVAKWVRQLLETHDEIPAKTQFGWTADQKSFVVGDKEIFADDIKENPPSTATAQYFNFFEPRGTLEGWKKVTTFYNKPKFEVHQFMFALAFGAPLMEFVPNIAGGIYHITSGDSGFGKTTGQWGGATVWGNHKKLVLDGDDTTNSMWNRAEVYKNLPVYVDEITNVPPKPMSDFVYRVTAGKQRNRQTTRNNQERYRGEEWSLLVGTSGNSSLLEKISTVKAQPKGETQRVLEQRTPQLLFSSDEAIASRELNENLAENYGHAGILYIQYILQRKDEVKTLLQRTTDKIIREANLTPQNRIWAAKTGAVITGVRIAKHLELIDWDVDNLLKWVIGRLRGLRLDMKEMDISITEIIAQYYSENIRGVLRIKSTDDARKGEDGLDMLLTAEQMPTYNWVARHEYDVGRLYLMVKPFKQWCVQQQLNYNAMVELATNELKGKKEKIRMGKGTTITLPPITVLSINWEDEHFNNRAEAQQDMLSMEEDADTLF